MTFEEARAQFPVLERYAYLNAGTFGPLARPVHEAIQAELDLALAEGRSSVGLFERMFPLRAEVREKFAQLIGTESDHVALTSSTTNGCHVVLTALGLGPDDEVVTTDSEHFGLIGPLVVSGVSVKVARVRERPAAEALDALVGEVTPRTRLVALSHVTWITGQVLPFAEVRRETGLPVLVDGAQSVGAIPVDVTGADYYTVSGQKWLCGPDLSGALFIAEPEDLPVRLPALPPKRHEDVAVGQWEPPEGVGRFDSYFTPMATLAGIAAALELAPEWAYERAREATERCRELLSERFEVVTEAGQGTLVAFRVDEPAETVRRLDADGVKVRDLPGTGLVRVSCGWWTSDEDLDRLIAALD